jgi:hypothetical protein
MSPSPVGFRPGEVGRAGRRRATRTSLPTILVRRSSILWRGVPESAWQTERQAVSEALATEQDGGTMALSRIGRRTAVAILTTLALGAAAGTAPGRAEPAAKPEDVVKRYLTAMQKGDFKTAYGELTPEMRGNLDEEKWVVQQTLVMKLGEVQIDSFEIFPAKIQGEKAIVPNLLKSKDKYINQTGANEYELYTLVRGTEAGWKIDQQQLVETDAVGEWFPPHVKAQ